ncbi:MAG: hypothetical protein HRT89_10425 [Lentisphaeria bacterium]|nr:alpha-amylase family glycosyl hydrolase [Lentisphaeria bacterium]NQZ68471.1 hypothetical protein [Lentisphaeria bacterium]
MSPLNCGITSRSYRCTKKYYQRFSQNDSLCIELSFSACPDEVVLELERVNGDACVRESHELQIKENTASIEVKLPTAGIYRYKIRFNDGGQWLTDTHPFAYFIVDPLFLNTLKVYTLIPRISGSIADWTLELDKIKELGFNTVHLLPLSVMDESLSPYAAKELKKIDPLYAPGNDVEKQFDQFIKRMKELDLHLCVDLVLNHVGINNSFISEHPDWIFEDEREVDGLKRAGWHYGSSWHKWDDLALINYAGFVLDSKNELWDYMTDYALYWARFAAETTGMIRLDNLHSSHKPFMKQLIHKCRELNPELIILGELFTDNNLHELTYDLGLNMILATAWEIKFCPDLRNYLIELHSHESLRFYCPVSSHDSGSPAEEFGDVLATIPRLLVSCLLSPGPTGIVQGVEHGIENKLKFIGPMEKRTWPTDEAKFSELIRKLNKLILEHPQFRKHGNLKFIDNQHDAILAALRFFDDQQVSHLILINMDIYHEQTICINTSHFCKSNKLIDLFSDEILEFNGDQQFILPAAGFKVYSTGPN